MRDMTLFPWAESAQKVASLDQAAAALRGDRARALALLQESGQSRVPVSFEWHTDVDLQSLWTYRPFLRWQKSRD